MRPLRSLWVFLAIAAASGLAGAQDREAGQAAVPGLPRLLIVSQPRGLERKADFVDMGFFLARSASELGRFEPIVYSPKDRLVAEAVKAGRLTASEAAEVLTDEGMRRVAETIGAVYLIHVSAMRTREGIPAQADMYMRVGGSTWTTVFTAKLEPFRPQSRRSQVLDAIHAHVNAIMPRIAQAPAAPAAADPGHPAEPERPTEPERTSEPARTPDRRPQTPTAGSATQSNVPSTAEILIERFRKAGDSANLIASLRQAINERPRDPRLRRELVMAMRSRGWLEAARDEAVRALALCGPNAELHRLLGEMYLESEQYAEALREIEEAVRLEPNSAQHRVSLGDVYLAQARLAEAESAYAAAREADPSSPLPRFRMALLRARALRLPEALSEMEEARKAAGTGTEGPYADTYKSILGVLEGACRNLVARLTTVRRDFLAGTLNREEAHKAVLEARRLASDVSTFAADCTPPAGFGTLQNLYTQAGALLAQSASRLAAYLESGEDADDRESTLLRQEAARQLDEAAEQSKKP